MLTSGPALARVVRLTTLLLSAISAAEIAACSDNPTTPSTSTTPSISRTESVVVGGGILSVSPLSLNFGTQDVGSLSASQAITISNIGTGPMTLSWVNLSGPDWYEFRTEGVATSIAPNTSGGPCTYPVTIAPGANCIAQISFLPSLTGTRSATFDVQTDGGTATAALTGTGVPPSADVSVSASATPSPATAGKPLTYTIIMRNAGPSAAERAQLTATVPLGTTFTSISADPDVVCATPAVGGTGAVSCTINASLEVGGARTIALAVKALSGGKNSVSNTVGAGSATPDPNIVNNITTVVTTIRGRK